MTKSKFDPPLVRHVSISMTEDEYFDAARVRDMDVNRSRKFNQWVADTFCKYIRRKIVQLEARERCPLCNTQLKKKKDRTEKVCEADSVQSKSNV